MAIDKTPSGIYQEFQEDKPKRKKRTQTKKNKFFIDGDTVTGFTPKGEPFIFDFDKFNMVVDHVWLMDKEGYIIANIRDEDGAAKRLRMHRWLLGLTDDYSVVPDHINRQRNDNRMSNLRIASYSLNGFNRTPGKNNKTGISGVFYRERKGKAPKWVATINIDGAPKQIGQCNTKEEAIKVRREAELKYYGEYYTASTEVI